MHDKIEKDKMERRTTSSNSKAEITKIKERVTTLEGKSIKKIVSFCDIFAYFHYFFITVFFFNGHRSVLKITSRI